jgi:molybdopterin-biosynthesis enzyme MoeA-like protein
MAKAKGNLLIALAGVPGEMKQMFQDSVLVQAREFAGDQAIELRKLKCFGKAESEIAALLGDLMRWACRGNMDIARQLRLTSVAAVGTILLL